MTDGKAVRADDPFNLSRFVEAQARGYDGILEELKAGRKRTHWMWYVFPQIEGLGFSDMSRRYALRSIDEAQAYLTHPLLGARLRECAEAVLSVEGRTANQIFGSPDDQKLRSSMTLFARATDAASVFAQVLGKYFGGREDGETVRRLGPDAAATKAG